MSTVYVDRATHKKLGAQLTRAMNLKDPVKVLTAVEAALDAWEGKAWPDNWHRWNAALGDAWHDYRWDDNEDPSITRRFQVAMGRMLA